MQIQNGGSAIQFLILIHGALMNAIDEHELLEYAANNVITVFKICETEEGRFSLVVNVNWREGDCILTSARKSPRLWASLNTLINYIKGFNRSALPVQIVLIPERKP
jgi:hypothetical protein